MKKKGATMMIDLNKLVGLAEDVAIAKIKAAGFVARIINRNGVPFMYTMDYRTDRVNLEIDNGKVTKADIG